DGRAETDELRVSVQTTGNQQTPEVAALGDGNFIVVWDSVEQDGSSSGVFARRVVGGVPTGPEFRVNTSTVGSQQDPRVAASDTGFVVVWDSVGQDGDQDGVFGQCFTTAASPLGT